MTFERVCSVSEIPPGASKVYEMGDRAIAVCNVGGQFYAVDDVCTHDEASLEQGQVEGYEIECPRHGARFDVRTGAVTALPAVVPIETFGVRVQGEDVEIDV